MRLPCPVCGNDDVVAGVLFYCPRCGVVYDAATGGVIREGGA